MSIRVASSQIEAHAHEAEGDRAGISIGSGDRHSDQRHHARSALAYFFRKAFEERPAAVEVNGAGQGKQGVAVTGKGEGGLEPEQPPETRREGEDGNGQRQGHPKAATEVGDHVSVVAMGAVL